MYNLKSDGPIDIIVTRPLPHVNISTNVWQPVTNKGVTMMRLAPIDWLPSASHATVQMLMNDAMEFKLRMFKAMYNA